MSNRVFWVVAALVATCVGWPTIERLSMIQPLALASRVQNVTVEQVLIRGNRRIPESTVKIWIGTREGDPYSPVQLDRDVRALYAQGHFEDVKVYAEEGTRGGKIITFEVSERPLLLDIKYEGLKSVQQSTVLEEFRKRSVGLSKESQYDAVKAKRAAAVVKELLANEGRPEAKVEPVIERISGTAVALTFKIDEGPRFRVADIEFEGNKIFSSSHLRSQMKLVKKLGLFTTFSSKDIYHKEKLETDLDRLRVLVYADHGYLKARFGEPRVEDVGRVGTWVPLIGHKGQGLKIVIPVEEGRQYRAGEIKIEDNTEFTADEIKTVIGLKSGDVVKGYTVVQKGLDSLKKLYGTRGYIQFNAGFVPDFKDDTVDPSKGVVDITFGVEEGKQYTLRRLEFIGNTFTRDNVMRREVLLNEGERYNEQLWDLSLLRLNQLGYFDQVKKEDATVNTNEKEGQVDLIVKVQEKGRQQVSFTGGVSGIGGSYIGINYSTNNLLGYGEALSFNVATGNLQKIVSFGFTEPYVKGRPISLGFNVFYQNYQFIGQGFGATTTQDIFGSFNGSSLFTQKTAGASVSASAPLSYFAKRFRMGRFIRLGLSYSYQTTDIVDPEVNRDSDPTNDILVTFRQSGVTQSTVGPSIAYNTLNSSLDPTTGTAMTLVASITGGPLGGKVNTIAPTFEFKHFRPLFAGRESRAKIEAGRPTRTLGMRFLFGHIGSFGTPFVSNSLSFVGGTPLFSRFFLGGEQDIRGYNIRGISPTAPIQTTFTTQNVRAQDILTGQTLKVRPPAAATGDSVAPSVLTQFVFQDQVDTSVPNFPAFIGGDSEIVFNLEYRIPIIGPLQFAPFFDIGSAFNLRGLSDQFERSEFIPDQILGQQILNPRGETATAREIQKATTPETVGGLPPGFKQVFIFGDKQVSRNVQLSRSDSGIFDNYRYSMGGELRVQVPVINVPFRLIFAWNPNARTEADVNPFFFERKRAIRFSVGRTF
ncbi:MAG TPA: outer membrane protein assembly factor BamA [Blastocatellia bacterium]|nr:outer membrane protein assembly factor BamA [Blastocatellia bacterium]